MRCVGIMASMLVASTMAVADESPERGDNEVNISWEKAPSKPIPIAEMPAINYKLSKDSKLKEVYWTVKIDYTDVDKKAATFNVNGKLPAKLDGTKGIIKMSETPDKDRPAPRDLIEALVQFNRLSGDGKLRIAFFDSPKQDSEDKEAKRRQVSEWLSLAIKIKK